MPAKLSQIVEDVIDSLAPFEDLSLTRWKYTSLYPRAKNGLPQEAIFNYRRPVSFFLIKILQVGWEKSREELPEYSANLDTLLKLKESAELRKGLVTKGDVNKAIKAWKKSYRRNHRQLPEALKN